MTYPQLLIRTVSCGACGCRWRLNDSQSLKITFANGMCTSHTLTTEDYSI